MKRTLLIALAIMSALCSKAQTLPTETDSVLKVANSQVINLIKDIPDDVLPDYGFRNRQEFGAIRFDEPIPVYTLKDSTVVFTETWRVPLCIGKEVRSLLTVIRVNGNYQAVDFGATGLAKTFMANKTPETIGLLRVYELRTDFIMEKSAGDKPHFIRLDIEQETR